MNNFWNQFLSAVAGGIISPVAVLAALSLFRNKLLDYFLSARCATHTGEITKAVEDRKGEIINALETRKGEITKALEDRKGEITKAVEDRKGEITKALEDRKGEIAQITENLKAALQMTSTIDLDLRNRRIAAYEVLWKLTSVLPRWSRAQDVTYMRLKQFSAEMTSWYFGTGGLYLSVVSMRVYNALQLQIWAILDKIDPSQLDSIVHGSKARDMSSDYDLIRLKCSKLRTSLTNDILSRREPEIRLPNAAAEKKMKT
jgi:hypothetical protein